MADKSNIFFVDLQGFKESGKFYLKELSILECDDNRSGPMPAICHCEHDKLHHYIFKSPFSWKRLSADARTLALWLKCYHHGFTWNHGDVEYSDIESTIDDVLRCKPGAAKVFVKGDQKVVWFNHFTRGKYDCVNIEDLGCTPNLRNLKGEAEIISKHCGKHDSLLHCAQQNVDLMHHWLRVLH